jgi:RNA polymerase sigma-70 factor (ECF subfamily)
MSMVIALLTDDAWLAMPPAPHEYHGPEVIGDFLRTSAAWRGPRRLRLVATRANTQPAFGCYLRGPDWPARYATTIVVLTLAGDRISAIMRFHGEGLAAAFGLPDPPG